MLLAVWSIVGFDLAAALLLLAPLVIVPLALELIEPLDCGLEAALHRAAVRWQLPAALVLLLAFALPTGAVAALAAAPWLLVTVLLAGQGLLRLRNGLPSAGEVAEIGALLFVAIGGGWTLLARLGWWPGDFEPVIALLTGVQFHFAGFVLPIVAAQQARRGCGLAMRTTLALILLGIPLLAIGITFSPAAEFIAAVMLVIGAASVGIGQLRLALRARTPSELTLFAVSGLSLLAGMALAMLYAAGEFFDAGWIDIATMIPLHGVANAVGFALLGVIGFSKRITVTI